jgi:hypothetical protein
LTYFFRFVFLIYTNNDIFNRQKDSNMSHCPDSTGLVERMQKCIGRESNPGLADIWDP